MRRKKNRILSFSVQNIRKHQQQRLCFRAMTPAPFEKPQVDISKKYGTECNRTFWKIKSIFETNTHKGKENTVSMTL